MSAGASVNNKSAFRSEMRAFIKSLSGEYIRESDAGIIRNVLALDAFVRAGRVFAYFSVKRECATADIIDAAVKMGKTVALPRTRPGGIMDFASAEYGLHEAAYGIPEPDASAPELVPSAGDIMLVPAVCCDVTGLRLGQGGGYYDRYLASHGGVVTACLCREKLLQERVPAEWNDMRVDFVITEERVIGPCK